jgi:phage head maturation protease
MFRCSIPTHLSALAKLALEFIEKGETARCSVGYSPVAQRTVLLTGERLITIVDEAILREVSLVRSGAVASTWARIERRAA